MSERASEPRERMIESEWEEALDVLVAAASPGRSDEAPRSAMSAARAIRRTVQELQSTQLALTEALIASQDRQLAVESLARVNLRGVASDDTVSLLLDRALSITGSRQVLLLERREVTMVRGDSRGLDEHVLLVREALQAAEAGGVRTVAADTAVLSVLDPDGRLEQHIAFFREPERPFSTNDLPLIEAIVSALGVMFAFRELHRREFERATVAREHELASVLAQSVIAAEPPSAAGIDIFARTVPAALTGGDFYVFGRTSRTIWFAVGDVAGKGLPAAMLMTRAVAACRLAFLAHPDDSLLDVFARIEDELFDHLEEVGVFITLVVGCVREDTGAVSLVNAGHSPVLLVGEPTLSLTASVPPLGILRGRVPTVWSRPLREGEVLVIGSDGLAEQVSPAGDQFGYERFTRLCDALRGRPLDEYGSAIFDAVRSFASGEPASDDATLMMVSRGRSPA